MAIVIEHYPVQRSYIKEKVAFEESKFMKPAIHNRNIAVAHDLVITVLHQIKSSICTHAG